MPFSSATGGATSSLLFIDATVPDHEMLLQGVAPGTEVHLLDSTQNAISQITQTLSDRSGIASLHILSHGMSGGLQLGQTWLTLETLLTYADQLQSWSQALTDGADILLYGCNVAQGDRGRAFVQQLSQLTQADVAASDDLTGNAALGGNWNLEVKVGTITALPAFQPGTLNSYSFVLPTERVSVTSNGNQDFNASNSPINAYYQSDISRDGRYVVFSTDAQGLVAGDTRTNFDVFLRDRQTNTTTLISSSGNGLPSGGNSYSPAISEDGRYVVFYSNGYIQATGLPDSGSPAVYIYDRQNATTTRIADGTVEAPGNTTNSVKPSISVDGRYIAYEIGGGINSTTYGQPGLGKVYVYDQQTQTSTLLGAGRRPAISADGRYVAFQADYTAYSFQIYRYDRQTGQTITISGNNAMTVGPSLSADGRFMVFQSHSASLVAGDTNNSSDIFVYDAQTGQISRVSVNSNGNEGNSHSYAPTISADGRYVAFHSLAANLVPGDTNNARDVFIHDRLTGKTSRVSTSDNGIQGNSNSFEADISADGNYISFTSYASTLVNGDTNNSADIFVASIGIPKVVSIEDNDADNIITVGTTQTYTVTFNNPMNASTVTAIDFSNAGTAGVQIGTVTQTAVNTFQVPITPISTGTLQLQIPWGAAIADTSGKWITPPYLDNDILTIVPPNTAPVLTDTVVNLAPVRFNAGNPTGAVGTLVSQLVGLTSGSGQKNVIDADANALTGIAITAANSTNGAWFYSTNNGANWLSLNGVSNTNARLLATDANTRLYFRPNPGFSGNLTDGITFRAWDQTSGSNGGTANTSVNGSSTAFSIAIDTAAIAVHQSQDPDFNGDGFTDILWRNSMTGENGFWQMNGSTLIQGVMLDPARVNSGWKIVGKADFTQDGQPDILWRNTITGDNGFWEMNGAAFVKAVSLAPVAASSGWEIVGVGDFTRDGNPDLLWRNTITGDNGFWEMNGAAFVKAVSLAPVAVSSGWEIVGVGDLTNDGSSDIVWSNTVTGANGFWRMNGSTFVDAQEVESLPPSSGWRISGVGDFNNDGYADLLWRNSLTGDNGIWRMNGSTRIGIDVLPGSSPAAGWNMV